MDRDYLAVFGSLALFLVALAALTTIAAVFA